MTKETSRPQGYCTGCGGSLPDNVLGWGLKWHDGAGFCAGCLYTFRESVGYFTPKEVKKRKRRKEESDARSQKKDS